MKIKRYFLFLVLLCSFVLVSGCSSDDSADASVTDGDLDDGELSDKEDREMEIDDFEAADAKEQESEESVCVCNDGPCCDGCRYLEGVVCDSEAEMEYGCPWGESCGEAVGLRYRERHCSGDSAHCDGSLGDWKDWIKAADCSGNEYCLPGETDCLPARSHETSDCWDNDVYWFDSCGEREELKDECGDEVCSGGACMGIQTWIDPDSGFEWQLVPADSKMNLQQARTYCETLDLDGGSWRLPNISELRTLVRGCPSIETGGACLIEDECAACDSLAEDICLSFSGCYSVDDCNPEACVDENGLNGCYWPQELTGSCFWYWSSSPVEDYSTDVWGIGFSFAVVSSLIMDQEYHVRCMR